MKRTNVSGLKARLSAYLAEVRGGQSVLVCDRNHPIARLVPVDELTEDGLRVDAAKDSLPSLRELPKVRLQRRINVVTILRESRDQR